MRIITVLFYSMIGLSNSDSLQCFSRISPQVKDDHASNNATCSVHMNYSHPASSTASSYDRSSSRSAGFCSSFKDASGELKSCDVDGICQEPGSQLMCHNGVLGTLHCCSVDYCNSDAKVELLNNESSVMCLSSSGEPISCSHSGCMNTTTYNSSGSIWLQEFGCADNRVCATNDSSLNQCSEFNTSSGKKRQCHCTTNYCNGLMTSVTAHSSSSTGSLIRANQVDRRSDELRRGWIFVGTSFGIVILFLIVFTLVIFIVKKYRDRRDRHLTYTYTQLTADLAEERETDDEYMLIA